MKNNRAITDNLENYKPRVKQGGTYTLVEIKFPTVVYEQLRIEAKSKGVTVSKLIEDYAIAGFVISIDKLGITEKENPNEINERE